MSEIYQHPPEVWDEATCAKLARATQRDGLGTPYPFKGYIPGTGSAIPARFGTTRYNGGTVIEGKWYKGEHRPMPELADGYEIVHVPSWGLRIQKKESNGC